MCHACLLHLIKTLGTHMCTHTHAHTHTHTHTHTDRQTNTQIHAQRRTHVQIYLNTHKYCIQTSYSNIVYTTQTISLSLCTLRSSRKHNQIKIPIPSTS